MARPMKYRTSNERIVVRAVLTPAEVSILLHLDAKTVTKRANKGIYVPFRTLGGHRRYEAEQFKKWFPNLVILSK